MKSWLLPRRWLTCDCLCARSRARHRYPCVSECWSGPAWGERSTVTCLSLPPCQGPYNSRERERALQTILERDMRSDYHSHKRSLCHVIRLIGSEFQVFSEMRFSPASCPDQASPRGPVLSTQDRPSVGGPRSQVRGMCDGRLSSLPASRSSRTEETIASQETRAVMQMMEILAASKMLDGMREECKYLIRRRMNEAQDTVDISHQQTMHHLFFSCVT